MKRTEIIYRDILYNAIEKENKELTQAYLAKTLDVSLSTVNLALKHLAKMNAVRIRRRNFEIIDTRKILFFWASIRNLDKDVIFKTRIELLVKDIEKQVPNNIVFTAFSAYKFKFKDVPADYSEVYVYGDEDIKKRFKHNDKNPNFFVLKKDTAIEKYGKIATIANLFVDLWNLRQWYAKDFLKSLEEKIGRFLE